jgi:hypothetical protein
MSLSFASKLVGAYVYANPTLAWINLSTKKCEATQMVV